MTEYMTIPDIVSSYDVSESTLRRNLKKLPTKLPNELKVNGQIVIKKEGRKWLFRKGYIEQFYTLRQSISKEKDKPLEAVKMDSNNDDLVNELRSTIDRLVTDLDRANKEIDRLNTKVDLKDNSIEGMMTELYKIQAKQIEAPGEAKKRKRWFRRG